MQEVKSFFLRQVTSTLYKDVKGDGNAMKKVLVIDDNPTIVELIKYAVNLQGTYDVVVAYDGVQGLERILIEHPDFVIIARTDARGVAGAQPRGPARRAGAKRSPSLTGERPSDGVVLQISPPPADRWDANPRGSRGSRSSFGGSLLDDRYAAEP